MSGKRLLDTLQLLSVAKSVAGKHLAIRQQQLDVYTRTSSITKGLKEQADNWVITAQAASALATRFNEKPSSSDGLTTRSANEESFNHIAQTDTFREAQSPKNINQDKLHDTKANSPERILSADEARRLQREAEFQIPEKQADYEVEQSTDDLTVSNAQETFYSPSSHSTASLSSLPRVKIPQKVGIEQGSDPHVASGPINADVFHSPKDNSNEPSEQALQGVFRSPRVAGLLLKKGSVTSNKATQLAKDEPTRTNTIDVPADGPEKSQQSGSVFSDPHSTAATEVNLEEADLTSIVSETLAEDVSIVH